MFAISHGEDQPADPSRNHGANATNRRASLKIWAKPANIMSTEAEASSIDPSL
jgi:hypothetical protein